MKDIMGIGSFPLWWSPIPHYWWVWNRGLTQKFPFVLHLKIARRECWNRIWYIRVMFVTEVLVGQLSTSHHLPRFPKRTKSAIAVGNTQLNIYCLSAECDWIDTAQDKARAMKNVSRINTDLNRNCQSFNMPINESIKWSSDQSVIQPYYCARSSLQISLSSYQKHIGACIKC